MKLITSSVLSFQTRIKKSKLLIQTTATPSLWLCLLYLLTNGLFTDPALARFPGFSDQEKREFIESLIEPSKEKKIFYRWQSETARRNLIEAGEMTPQLYKYFMKHTGASGAGVYVAENISSSSEFGDTIIQVEIEPGYKFLDLTDSDIRNQLRKKGITNEDVYRLNSKVAVKDSSGKSWWVLKEQKGVKFKSFSSKDISLDILLNNYQSLDGTRQQEFFRASISEDILSRANKNSFVFENPHALEIIEKSYGRKYVEEAVKNHMASRPLIERFSDGIEILKNIGKYLSKADRKRIVSRGKTTPIQNIQESIDFLKYAKGVLSDVDIKRIIDIAKKISPKNMQESIDFLNHTKDFLSNADINKIVENTPITHSNTRYPSILNKGRQLIYQAGENLSAESGNKLVEKLIPYIDSYTVTANLLSDTATFLSPKNRERIIDKTLSYIKTPEDSGSFLLNADRLSDTEIKRFIKKAVPTFYSLKAAANFLERSKSFLSKDIVTKIVIENALWSLQKIPIAFNPQIKKEVADFLKSNNKYLSEGDKERLMKEVLNFITSEEELKTFQSVLPESEYNEALKKFQTSPKRTASRMSERLKCLKRWLSIP